MRAVEKGKCTTYLHKLFIVDLYPAIVISINTLASEGQMKMRRERTWAYNASVSVFTTTQARTKRSKVIPGGGPYPGDGPEAEDTLEISDQSTKFRGTRTVFLLDQCQDGWRKLVSETCESLG